MADIEPSRVRSWACRQAEQHTSLSGTHVRHEPQARSANADLTKDRQIERNLRRQFGPDLSGIEVEQMAKPPKLFTFLLVNLAVSDDH